MSTTSSTSSAPTLFRQRLFVLGLLLFFVVLSVHYSFKALNHRSAILRWREQILDLEHGVNIYDVYLYPNPPIMAILLSPLTHLPPLAGALGWFYLKVGMTLASLYWIFRMVQSAEHPFPPWSKALVVLLSLRPIMGDLAHGNVNLFILFLVAASLYAFTKKRDVGSGVLLALAISCKVTPALFVPYFLWKRAWKALAGCAAGLLLFLIVVPGFCLGWKQNLTDLASWTEKMVVPYTVGGIVTSEHNNQSLPGLIFRLATHSPSFSTYNAENQYTPTRYDNLFDLSPGTARLLIKGCMISFALLGVWVCRTPTSQRGNWRAAAEYSLVILGMLLFSERTWKHHCVTLVLPFAVICYYLSVFRTEMRLRVFLIGCLALVVALMATTSTSLLESWHEEAAKVAQVYGAYVWAYLILVAALVVLLRRNDDEARADNEPVRDLSGARYSSESVILQQRLRLCLDTKDRISNQETYSPANRLSL